MMTWTQVGEPTKHYIKIGKRKLRCTVYVKVAYDEEQVEGSVSWDDPAAEQEYYERFYSGELMNAVVQVQAFWQDAEGSDLMGGCRLRSSFLDQDIGDLVKDYGMLKIALDDLKSTIKQRSKVYAGLSVTP